MLRTREIRESRGISQRWLARQAGVPVRTLARIELDGGDTYVSTLLKLARALQVEPGELLRRPDQSDQVEPGELLRRPDQTDQD